MNVSEFKQTLERLRDTNSRNEKKKIIREVSDSPAAISFLSGSEYDDAGLGKKTVLECAQALYETDGTPTVSESLEEYGPSPDTGKSEELSALRELMERLANKSGNDQKDYLKQMLFAYDYPSVVAHACLNDWPTGVSDTTIANALGLRDSLPFYDSVVDAAEAPNPVMGPVIHNAFDPMLAKSESNMPDDPTQYAAQPKLDGHRLIIHIGGHSLNQDVTAFTRRRTDVTESLPELQEIDWPNGDWIVDCEVIAETGDYSDTSERVGRKAENVNRDVEMEFAVFDVIQFATEPVYDEPFAKRHGYARVFADLTADERVYSLPVYTDIRQARDAASDYEGLIWKDINAPYKFGKRSSSWVKEKHQAETVDLVATEFVEGEGRLDGTLGKIGLETADGHSVGATGSGFSDEQRDEVWENQDEYLGATLEVEAEAFDEALRFPIFQRWRIDDGEPDTLERVENVMPEP
jgi:ATP-dependent DNA ligase